MDIDRKIEAMLERLERSRPCKIIFTLETGETIETDPVGAWDTLNSHMLTGDVVNVAADKDEYAGVAGLMTALYHPAPNRRIADYE